MIAKKIRDDLPEDDLLSYLEAILRIYNLQGRRDNKYKARIKILVHEIGTEAFAAQVEEEWQRIRDGALKLPEDEIRRIDAYFAPPAFVAPPAGASARSPIGAPDPAFERWIARNTHAHKQRGYAIVTISLKPIGGIPGDASAAQMDAVADLAERYSFDEVRVTHEQNLVLPHVRLADLRAVYDALVEIGLAEANAGLVTDIIACPGLDYCALANARSIPIAQRISERLAAAAGPDRRSQDQDLGLHQRLRPPPRRPHRHPGRREARRGALPAAARRVGRGGCRARGHHRAGLRPGRASSMRSRRWSTPI